MLQLHSLLTFGNRRMLQYLSYAETSIQEYHDDVVDRAGIRLLIKREDLNHPTVSGNKWWKLKYNILAAKEQGFDTILTFGGAYSNHIYATASAARSVGLKSIGIIRGEETFRQNATLAFAVENGMQLKFISRTAYRERQEAVFHEEIKKKFGNVYVIPEGGTNDLAVKGCKEFALQLGSIAFDYLAVAVGTAGTIAGLIAGIGSSKKIIGVSVLKNGAFLNDDIEKLIAPYASNERAHWTLLLNYHFGGYGKVPVELIEFIEHTRKDHALPLDVVYTSKMFYGILQEIKKGSFKRGDTILAIHTGGLQGNAGINKG